LKSRTREGEAGSKKDDARRDWNVKFWVGSSSGQPKQEKTEKKRKGKREAEKWSMRKAMRGRDGGRQPGEGPRERRRVEKTLTIKNQV